MYTDPSGNMTLVSLNLGMRQSAASMSLAVGGLYVAYNIELYATLYGSYVAAIENQSWALSESLDSSNKAEKSSDRKKYKSRCTESPPPNLKGLEKLKWILQRNKDCKQMRENFGKKWFDELDDAHSREIENLKRAIQKLEEEIAKHGG